jgi:hypothetical protein
MGLYEDVMGLLNFAVNNPITSGVGAGISSGQQAAAQGEADYMTDTQMEDMLGLAMNNWQETMGLYNAGSAEQLGAIQDTNQQVLGQAEKMPGLYDQNRLGFLGDLSGRHGDIAQGYGDRYRFAEGQIADFGRSAAADIDRRFDEESARSNQDLINRGLMSSTEAATQGAAVTERRAGEQRRLQDDLMRNRVSILSDLSGQGLSADERMSSVFGAYDAAMRGDTLAAEGALTDYYQQAGNNLSNYFGNNAWNVAQLYERGGQNVLNTLGGFNFMPPPSNLTPGQLGQGAVDPVGAPGQSTMGQIGDVASAAAAVRSLFSGGGAV